MNAMTLAGRIRSLATSGSSLRRHLAGAALGSLALSLSSHALMFAISIMLARLLGAEGFGVYASATALLVLLGVPTTLGLPILVIRLLASYRVNQQWALMRGLLLRASQFVLMLAMLVAGGGALIVWMLGQGLDPIYADTLWWTMALLPLMALISLISATLRGLHHVVLGQLPEKLLAPGLLFVLLTSWTLLDSRAAFTPGSAMALRFASVALAFSIGALLLLRRIPPQLHRTIPHYDTAHWLRSAAPLLFLGGMGILSTQTDVLMLAALQGAESAGVYRAASRGAALVAFSLAVINTAVQPTISQLYASDDMRQLQRLITLVARSTLAIALPIALFLMFFGQPLLGFAFGSEFERAALPLTILCAAQVVNAGAGSVNMILNMTGYERDSAMGMAAGTVTNVVLNAIFIPFWGIEGAALATGLGLVVWNVVLAMRVRKRLGLDSTAFGC